MRTTCSFALAAVLLTASSGVAATIRGSILDSTGAAVPAARVTLRVVATGQETVVDTDAQGRYRFETPAAGT